MALRLLRWCTYNSQSLDESSSWVGPETHIIRMIELYIALFSKATACVKITMPPVVAPAFPSPAMALPIIKPVLVGVAAQIRLPRAKNAMLMRKVHLTLNDWYARPYRGMHPQDVREYAAPYHRMSAVEWNSAVILGIGCPAEYISISPQKEA